MANQQALLTFEHRAAWRKWLEVHHRSAAEAWLVLYKKGVREASLSLDEAVKEALCFGWIDSLIKRIDERGYVRKFSKRKPDSNWSALNRKKVGELIDKGLMTEFGLEAIEVAKRNGQWEKRDEREEIVDVDGLREVIRNRTGRVDEYDRLSESLKKHYSVVYFSAKREEYTERGSDG